MYMGITFILYKELFNCCEVITYSELPFFILYIIISGRIQYSVSNQNSVLNIDSVNMFVLVNYNDLVILPL